MTGFGFRKVAVVSLGMCLAAVACGDDSTDTPGESSAGAAGEGGKASAGASGEAGSTQAAGAGDGGTSAAGDSSTAGTDPAGGANVTAGTGGTANGGTSPGGQASGGAAAGEGGTANGGAPPSAPGGAGAGGQPDDVDGGSGGEGGQPNSCVVASYGDVAAVDGYALFEAGDSSSADLTLLNLSLQDGTPHDEIEVELWDGLGTFEDGLAPGTYEIDGDNLDYRSCALCVVLYDQVNEIGGNRGWYMATGGTVTLTSVEGNLTGSLSNVTFQHVYLDNGGHSVPWADGCTTSLESIDFDTEITEP